MPVVQFERIMSCRRTYLVELMMLLTFLNV